MEVTIVGSGTLLPDDRHRSPGHLVEWADGKLLLDCGSGVLHGLARDGCDWRAISHVALSHFHTDHIGDLPALLWAWRHGVAEEGHRRRVLLGPSGTGRLVEALARAHGDFILDPGSPLEVVELGPSDRWADPAADLLVRTHPVRHAPESVAYRVEADGAAVGYTGDTGPHPPLGEFFRRVGLLIAECAVPDPSAAENHLSPVSVAELAVAADPEILALTHLYPEVHRAQLPGLLRSLGFAGTVHVAEDGLRIPVGP